MYDKIFWEKTFGKAYRRQAIIDAVKNQSSRTKFVRVSHIWEKSSTLLKLSFAAQVEKRNSYLTSTYPHNGVVGMLIAG